ncbi:Boi2 protein [Martiniozyma asiatica (nom. inval.)]|nr:Boi2 protein [Martiniozyma asiatica]
MQQYVAIKDFEARLNDELSIKKGDSIELISDDSEFNDGWFMGKNLSSGKVGLYPKIFTKVKDNDSYNKPTLLRSRSRRNPSSPITATPNSTSASVSTSNVEQYVNDIDNALSELQDRELQLNEVDSWSYQDVSKYFQLLGFDENTSGQFVKHKISGAILLELDLTFIKELDIDSFGTRFEIYKEIENLKRYKEATGKSLSDEKLDKPLPQRPNSVIIERGHNTIDSDSDFVQIETPEKDSFRLSGTPKDTFSSKYDWKTPQNNSSDFYSSRDAFDEEVDNVAVHNNNNNNNNNHSKANGNDADVGVQQFLSPRRAPQPPSYPSPVSRNPMKFGINSPDREDFKSSTMISHSRQSSGVASSVYQDIDIPPLKSHSRQNSDFYSKRFSTVLHLNTHLNDLTNSTSNSSASNVIKSAIEPTSIDLENVKLNSNERRSVSANDVVKSNEKETIGKRHATTIFQRRPLAKSKTSAFMEGIQSITAAESTKSASFSGLMYKRGSMVSSWKRRYFTLHKTRLSYFLSANDSKEKGLIDITSHRVLPVNSESNSAEDRLSAVYAATAGYGRYCFKLVPPAPGSRKNLTFTQQKVHYFVVESAQEMRDWMSFLIKATIELDESVPVISSCSTPTIPLQKAQELMVVARQSAQENLENLEKLKMEDDEKNGMSTPYLVTSGKMQPNFNKNITPSSGSGSTANLNGFGSGTATPPVVTNLDENWEQPGLKKEGSFRRVLSLRRNKD